MYSYVYSIHVYMFRIYMYICSEYIFFKCIYIYMYTNIYIHIYIYIQIHICDEHTFADCYVVHTCGSAYCCLTSWTSLFIDGLCVAISCLLARMKSPQSTARAAKKNRRSYRPRKANSQPCSIMCLSGKDPTSSPCQKSISAQSNLSLNSLRYLLCLATKANASSSAYFGWQIC